MSNGIPSFLKTSVSEAISDRIVVSLTREEMQQLSKKYLRICNICDCVKPPRTHHCRKCDRCVIRMDHHCPWVGNCVGSRTFKPFLLFNLYVCLLSLYYSSYFTIVLIRCYEQSNQCDLLQPNSHNNKIFIPLVACYVVSIPYVFFTLAMLVAHLNMIRTGTSSIDSK
jgi:hypothetical protein